MRSPRNISGWRHNRSPRRKFERHLDPKNDCPPERDRPAESLRGKGELILVVDDEPMILRIMTFILESANYRVVCADNGREGMTIFAQAMSVIAAVITDINMPSMDGIALIRAIAGMKRDITFLAATGEDESQISELESLGVKNFLIKPFNIDNLLGQLRKALEGRPSDLIAL